MNVIGDRKSPEPAPRRRWRRVVPITVAVLTLVVTGVVAFRPAVESVQARPLFIDEKESVIVAFSKLPAKRPELAGWIENVKQLYSEGAFPSFLSDRATGSRLLRFENDTIVFSRAFFDADPITQEVALLEMVLAFHQGDPRKHTLPSEVAVRGK